MFPSCAFCPVSRFVLASTHQVEMWAYRIRPPMQDLQGLYSQPPFSGSANSLSTSTGAGSIPRFILDRFNSQNNVRLQIRTFTNAPRGYLIAHAQKHVLSNCCAGTWMCSKLNRGNLHRQSTAFCIRVTLRRFSVCMLLS